MAAEELKAAYLHAARRALGCFPLSVRSVEYVCISENVTFRVGVDDSAAEYVLRLHRPGYNSLAELEAERSWTAALRDAGVRVQAGLRTVDGEHFCRVAIPGKSEQRYAGITSWFPGTPLSAALENDRDKAAAVHAYAEVGRLAAMLHNQSSSWNEPAEFTRPGLDLEGLLGEQPRWGRFWEHAALSAADRDTLLAARHYLRARLQDYGNSPDRFGLIHADLHTENIIVHDGALSLIDFDDAAYGWYVYDLATALIDHWGQPDFAPLAEGLLTGYRECRPLTAQDEAMLPLFVLLRGMAVIGWLHQRPEHAGSGYFTTIREQVVKACHQLPRVGGR